MTRIFARCTGRHLRSRVAFAVAAEDWKRFVDLFAVFQKYTDQYKSDP